MSKEVQVITGKMRQTFDEATKRRIVSESYAGQLSLNQFAKKRGISPATLCQWRKQFKTPEGSFESMPFENQTVEQLRHENSALKTELFKIKAYLGHKIYELDVHTMS